MGVQGNGDRAGTNDHLERRVQATAAEILADAVLDQIRTMADDPLNYPAGELREALLTLRNGYKDLRKADTEHETEVHNGYAENLRHAYALAAFPLTDESVPGLDELTAAKARLRQLDAYLKPLVLAENYRQFGWQGAFPKPQEDSANV